MSKHLQKLFALVLVCCALLGSSTAWGQVTISDGSKYAQDFNSLAASGTSNTWSNNTTLPGWYSTRTVYQANNGGSNAGALYSFGTAADDRALGAVQSNTTGAIAYGIQFQNTSGKKIASLKVRYTGEQWRNGGNASAQSIEFSYEVTATAATEVTNLIGSFIRVSELDFTSPITGTTAIALNGNAAENRKVIEHTFDVVVEEGEFISIKWIDANDAGNDHGLSIDDFELTPVFAAPDVTAPAVASFNPANGATDVPTTSNLVITFDENVKKGTGSIELREAGSSTLRASIDVTSENVIVDGKTVTVITSLAAGKNYYVEIPATAFADASGNAFEGISNATTWAFTTSAVVTPVLSASLQNLYFGYVQPNQNKTLSFIVGGSDVTEDITVSVTDGYTLSIEENGTYEASITLAAAEASAGKTVFVKYSPTTTAQSAGVITISSVGATDVQVKVLGTALNGYAQNFDDCSFGNSLVGGWKSYSTIGDQVWECSSFGNNGTNGVQINGFSSGAKENQDYLISPSLDLSNLVVPIASFWTKSDFSGPALSVMISTNYDGVSDPTTATWTILNADLPAVNSGIWKQSTVDLSAYKQSNVHIAFVYTSSTAAGASRWSIDDFSLNTESYYLTTSNLAHNFGIVAPQGASVSQSFTFSILGLQQDLTLSVPSDFKISRDGNDFAQSITYTKEEAAGNNTFYVQFTPGSDAFNLSGGVQFTSGSQLDVTKGSFTGSSKTKEHSLDIVTWNMEWFGADKDEKGAELGPADEALQYANAKKVFTDLNADILALQEVSNDTEIQRLAGELGYNFVVSDAYSYSWDATRNLVPQKLYFLYKPEVAKVKNQKVLLKKFYEDVRNGQYADAFVNYPEGGAKFWASGRLPFMVEFETTINNVKQNISLVNLHTRANSGTDVSKHTQRKFDVEMLKDSLDAHYAGKNIMILGDYNDDVDVSVVNNLPSTFEAYVKDANYKALTLELSKTGAYTYESGSFKSFLDHITVSSTLADDYIDGSITIENQFLSSITGFRSTTSDHMPVSARFDMSATPMVTFAEATVTKAEGFEKYNVNLTLSAAQATEQTVTISVANGATASSADYTITGATNGVVTVTVPANATTAAFELEITDDNLVETTEQVTFQITDKSANLTIGGANTYAVTITDNDKSVVTFAAATKEVSENAGVTEVTLNVDQAPIADQQITVAVTNGTGVTYGATADYTTAPAITDGNLVVTLPAGATSVKFDVTVNDDSEVEANEQVTFKITDANANVLVGEANAYTLTITDNDKSTVTFAVATKEVKEDAGTTEVTLSLDKAPVAAQQVTIAVTNGTGVTYGATGDYTTAPEVTNGNMVVTVPAGATSVKFNVTVNDDTDTEGAEQVSFNIASVSAGLAIGTAKTYTLTIEANDTPTGIADGTKGQFSVYPTIVNGGNVRLMLPERVASTAKVTMVVYSTEGRKVMNVTGTQSEIQTKLNNQVSNLSSGIYMILIETGKEFFQTKMVKK